MAPAIKDLPAFAGATAVSLFLLLVLFAPRFWRRAAAVVPRRRLPAWLTLLLPAVLALAIRLALLPWAGVPAPAVHDEFAYLLAADTFAAGRVTNRPHPMWTFFESFHIIVQPTYTAKYPPGQGLALALGQAVFGRPWAGVLLSVAAMVAATSWMLAGWLPAGWTRLGGILMAFQYGVCSYWMNSYWGGAVAAFGGALLLGAYRRLTSASSSARYPLHALLLALAMGMLANSRPWEGLVLSLPLGSIFLYWVLHAEAARRRERLRRALLPFALTLGAAIAATSWYCWRVTGDPLRLPYSVHEEQYSMLPLLPWQQARPEPSYRHAEIRRFHTEWEPAHQAEGLPRNRPLWLAQWPGKLDLFTRTIVSPTLMALGVAFYGLLAWLVWRRREFRIPAFLLLCCHAGVVLQRVIELHYLAPAVPLCLLLQLGVLRLLHAARYRGRRLGQAVAAAGILAAAVVLWNSWRAHTAEDEFGVARRDLVRMLEAVPGRHVVMVRYSPRHDVNKEWVYNRADIDGARIVWARWQGDRNSDLFAYFRGRSFWLLEPDTAPGKLAPLR